MLLPSLVVMITGRVTMSAPYATRPGTDRLAQVRPVITYVAANNTIEVRGKGALVRLNDIDDTLHNSTLLERVGDFEWELKANLKTFDQVRLELHGQAAGGDVNWLKLKSDRAGFVAVESSNGQISLRNTKITSWDPGAGTFDFAFQDGSGRAYIAIKNRTSIYTDNRMDVIDSEVAYLGFLEETAYGISWKVLSEEGAKNPGILGRGMTGIVTGSKFHHNYFGAYVWGAGDMVVRNNEFYDNFYYGFDAHTVTQRTLVEDNYSHDNGGHGIIFADRCTDNTIRRNRSANNKGHGIMLHEQSDNNTISDNEVTGNDDGIPLYQSSNNTVAGNIIRDNHTGVRLYGRENIPSRNNLFENNEISGSRTYGLFIYDGAVANTLSSNRVLNNRNSGIYLKSAQDNIFSGNEITGNEYGVQLDTVGVKPFSTGNQFRNNVIQGSRQYGIYSYPPAGSNALSENQFSGNLLGDLGYAALVGGQDGSGRTGAGLLKPVLFISIIGVAAITAVVLLLRRYTARRRRQREP